MSGINWGQYSEAYEAIWDKLVEILASTTRSVSNFPADYPDSATLAKLVEILTAVNLVATEATLLLIKNTDGIKKIVDPVTVVQSVAANLKATVTQASIARTVTGTVSIDNVLKTGTLEDFDITASGVVVAAQGSGYKIRLKFVYFCLDADEFVYLRFGGSGKHIFPLRVKGAVGGNLIGGFLDGGDNEALNAVKAGANNMSGFVIYEKVAV